MKAAITGASGYVGAAIARCFRAHGWEVAEMGRRSELRYELGGEPPAEWSGIDALVHCAGRLGRDVIQRFGPGAGKQSLIEE